MIIVQFSYGLALISSCTDRRETISEKRALKFKIKFLIFTKNLAKQLVLVAKGTLKLGDSQRKTLGG
jgi:hypothetical protein